MWYSPQSHPTLSDHGTDCVKHLKSQEKAVAGQSITEKTEYCPESVFCEHAHR
jgi:hypothetical protein